MSKRVLFFCDTTLPGGVDTCTRNLALAARRRGWDLLVVMDRAPGADRLAVELQNHDLPFIRTTLHKQWDEAERVAVVDALLRDYAPTVAHIHLPAPWAGVVPRERALAAGLPYAATEHNVSPWFTLAPTLRARIERTYWGSLAHVAVSGATKRLLIEQFAMPGEKIVVIPNNVDTSYWRPPTAAERAAAQRQLGLPAIPIIVCVARFAPEKGVDVLLRAGGREPLSARPWTLLLAGEGPEEPNLRALAAELGLADRVRWLGWRPDVRPLLAAADLFVLPSRSEGQPVAVLEAMATGVPVVATAVGGASEALDHGRVGTLVPPDDPAALSAALAGELAAGERPERVRLAREHIVARHDLTENLDRTMALWTTGAV